MGILWASVLRSCACLQLAESDFSSPSGFSSSLMLAEPQPAPLYSIGDAALTSLPWLVLRSCNSVSTAQLHPAPLGMHHSFSLLHWEYSADFELIVSCWLRFFRSCNSVSIAQLHPAALGMHHSFSLLHWECSADFASFAHAIQFRLQRFILLHWGRSTPLDCSIVQPGCSVVCSVVI